MFAQVAGQFQAVHVRQAQGRGDQVDRPGLQGGLGLLAGFAADELHVGQLLAQDALDHLAHDLGAVHDHDAGAGGVEASETRAVHFTRP